MKIHANVLVRDRRQLSEHIKNKQYLIFFTCNKLKCLIVECSKTVSWYVRHTDQRSHFNTEKNHFYKGYHIYLNRWSPHSNNKRRLSSTNDVISDPINHYNWAVSTSMKVNYTNSDIGPITECNCVTLLYFIFVISRERDCMQFCSICSDFRSRRC